ncbi:MULTISPECIES: glutamate racemase [unclassified Modicisalibacter]|uniref:glutamate racemase n=1 Tax=unclassified Modicisalibacter TaxID=2679913 RepID=UPI001CCCC8B5|nr:MULTISPECIES: glutamate racemase [unclassified Modicisalibacter]MBZ9557370.1 glutamate racemase [Modicisalibacter sp. R2A 31.J]MBZ9573964.1 glutamate racemase [Modicisalibacter sp. MOD 31.J]
MAGPILIFDSGVGGLSVAAAIRERLPAATLAYVCDNAMLPYGTKPDAWLVERITAVCREAVRVSDAAVLVVACNTASTLALEALRAALDIPVVGTVPAIKPAAALSRTGTIALLATSATVNRAYTRRLIEEFAGHCRVLRLAADPLVAEAERHLAGEPADEATLVASLAPLWREPELDTVVLGCTHFPLLRARFAACAPRVVSWVDSGDAIARRVAAIVATPLAGQTNRAWATAPGRALAAILAERGFGSPQVLDPGAVRVPVAR